MFDAWLTPAWGDWLPPSGATCEVAMLEPTVGGRFQVHMVMPDGRRVGICGDYREVDPPRRLVLTWLGDYSPHQTVITVTFVADGGGTLMTLSQEGFPDADQRAGYERGWTGAGGSFDKLDGVLAGARG